MKHTLSLCILLLASLGFFAPCQAAKVDKILEVSYEGKLSSEPVLVQSIDVDSNSEEAALDAVRTAATNRGWTVSDLENGSVMTKLTHRSYESTLTFTYNNGNIEVYSVSYKINKNTLKRKARKEPAGWIRNLHKDILVQLGLMDE